MRREVSDAMQEMRDQTDKTTSGFESLSSGIKGIGFAALAAVGIETLKDLADKALDVAKALNEAQINAERLQKQLFYSNGGNLQAIAADVEWLHQISNELGLDFQTASNAYAQFAGAVKNTGIEKDARQIFADLSTAFNAFGMSTDDAKGAMLALVQMSAKGTVQAEEFRGQLAERLPAALQAATQALGVTTAEFNKMMQDGDIVADTFLPKFAAELRKMSADSAKFGGDTQKATAQFINAWNELKTEVSASGVGSFISGQLTILTDAFNDFSASVKKARDAGAGFWGQMAAGAGAVISFASPMNALHYKPQSDAEKAASLKKRIAETQAGLNDWSLTQTVEQKQSSIQTMQKELQQIEARIAAAGKDVNAKQKEANSAAASKKAAEGRAKNYLEDGKHQTDKEQYNKSMDDEEKAFKAATVGLEKGSKLYLDALAAHEARKAKLIDDYAKKGRNKQGERQDRELADLRSQIVSQQQLSGLLNNSKTGLDPTSLTSGERLKNKLEEERKTTASATARVYLDQKIALADQLITLEKSNELQKKMIASGRELAAGIVAFQQEQTIAAQGLVEQYQTTGERESHDHQQNQRAIQNNVALTDEQRSTLLQREDSRHQSAVTDSEFSVRSDLGLVSEREKIVKAHDDMQRRITQITKAGTEERARLEAANAKKTAEELKREEDQRTANMLGNASTVADGYASLLADTVGKQSAAYKAMFLTSKAAAFAETIINANVAYGANLKISPAYAEVIRGLGYASAGLIAAQTVVGMAHDGIDNIPSEGTWLLDKGERVVDSRTNADLKDYLKQSKGSAGGINIVINNNVAGVDVQASTTTDSSGAAQLTLEIVKQIASSVADSKLAAATQRGGLLYGR